MSATPGNSSASTLIAAPDLRRDLQSALAGRFCLVGLGNAAHGDDGVGVRLAESLEQRFGHSESPGNPRHILVAGTTPERWLNTLTSGKYDRVLFLDAVAFGGAPGSAVFLNSREIKSRFPQISTHSLALGTLTQLIEADRQTKVALLGIEPGSLSPSDAFTPAVRTAFEALLDLISEALDSCHALVYDRPQNTW